jgi:SAM-dependent methyltransferase
VIESTAARSSAGSSRDEAAEARSTAGAAPPCPVCHSPRVATAQVVNRYAIWKCLSCGLFWVPGVTDAELQGFYESDYFTGSHQFGYADYVATERVLRANAAQLLSIIRQVLGPRSRPPTLIDVGSAHGFLVDEACKAGFEASGVDCSAEAVRYARETLGRKIQLGTLHEAHLPAASLDAITSIGSIEHFNDPIAIVDEVSRIAKPGAVFVITTVDTRVLGGIFRFKPPEHLYYFSRRNLTLLLNEKGFTVERASLYWSNHVLGEVAGLVSKLVFGSTIDFGPLLARLPLRNLSFKLPNNEMIVVARKR